MGDENGTTAPWTVQSAGIALRDGSVTAVQLVQDLQAAADVLDPQLGTWLVRFDEQALQAAEAADRELSAGVDRGPLHGIPLGIKDIIATD